MKYKIYDEFDYALTNYNLTELITIKEGKKKGLGNKSEVYFLCQSFLRDYGIILGGKTWLYDKDENINTIEINHCSLVKDFPIENEIILQQMYGYQGDSINIGIFLGTDEDCSYSFSYNLDDFSCKFLRHYYGSNEELGEFSSLKEFLTYIKQEYGE